MNEMSEEVHVETNKPRSKVWIFGGVGCLFMILLCVGGLGTCAYLGQDLAGEMANISSALTTSTELEEEIGSPLTITPDLVPKISEVDGVARTMYTGVVSGPDGEGTFKAEFSNEGFDYELESLTVDVNGKQIEISDEEELDLGIDLGE